MAGPEILLLSEIEAKKDKPLTSKGRIPLDLEGSARSRLCKATWKYIEQNGSFLELQHKFSLEMHHS